LCGGKQSDRDDTGAMREQIVEHRALIEKVKNV
jgi:hypothetical protein